jgi:hypothetical protein
MSRHNHSHCLHDLKYCEHCDVVYCVKCDREWGGHSHSYWYWGGTPYRVTWTNTEYALYNSNTNLRVTDPQIISAYNSQPHTKEPQFTAQTGELTTACTHHN